MYKKKIQPMKNKIKLQSQSTLATPMVGMMKLMDDPVHHDFIFNHLLKREDQESCLMFMSFYAILMEMFPQKTGPELLTMLTNAYSNARIRHDMIRLWKNNDVNVLKKNMLEKQQPNICTYLQLDNNNLSNI